MQEVKRAFLSLGQPQNFEAGGAPFDSSFLKPLRIFPGAIPESPFFPGYLSTITSFLSPTLSR